MRNKSRLGADEIVLLPSSAQVPQVRGRQVADATGRQSKAGVCYSNIGLVPGKTGTLFALTLESINRARGVFEKERWWSGSWVRP